MTMQHLQEAGHLRTTTAGTDQPANTTPAVPDLSKMDTKTSEGREAFNDYVRTNAKELIRIDV